MNSKLKSKWKKKDLEPNKLQTNSTKLKGEEEEEENGKKP